MRLGALDIGPAVRALRLAPEIEAAGYHRYWIGEHQPQPQPQLVAALVAGVTESIRVGTAGVLLHYAAPSRTAYDFRFLAACYPDRIDAGVCAGIIDDPEIERDQLDGRERAAHLARYDQRVSAFVRWLRATAGDAEGATDPPQIWRLGASRRSAQRAAAEGLCFAYTLFHGESVDDPDVFETYRAGFAAPADGSGPCAALALAGVCADSDREAARLAGLDRNPFFRLRIVGSPDTCRAQVLELAARYGADEIVFATLSGSYEQRLASYRLLAEAMRSA